MEISAREAATALQGYRKTKAGGRNGGRNRRCRECFGYGYVVQMRIGEWSGLRETVRPVCAECHGKGIVPARKGQNRK